MNYRQMVEMPKWKAFFLCLFFIINTISCASWRRRGEGIWSLIRYPWSLLKYIISIFLSFVFFSWRAMVLLSAYAWFRRIDDVMDEDMKAPKGYTRGSHFSQKLRIFESSLILTEDTNLILEDILLVYLLKEADFHKIDVRQEIINLWSVMLWEDRRWYLQPTQEEIIKYATLADKSVLGLCVRILGGDISRFNAVAKIMSGIFTRTDWLLDVETDLRRGSSSIYHYVLSVNYGVCPALLRGESWAEMSARPFFLKWYEDEINLLSKLWKTARTTLGKNFGGVFPSRFHALILEIAVVCEFEKAFKVAFARRSKTKT